MRVGEFDLNTLPVDGYFFNPEGKSSGFKDIWICVDGSDLNISVLYEKGNFIRDIVPCWEVHAVAYRTL